MLRAFFFVALLFLTCLNAKPVFAQDISYKWSETGNKIFDFEELNPLKDGNYMLLKSENAKQMAITRMSATIDPTIAIVDAELKVVAEQKIELAGKSNDIIGLRQLNGNNYLIFLGYDKATKSTDLFAYKINPVTAMVDKKISLGSYNAIDIDLQPVTKFYASPDSTKVLLFTETPSRKKTPKEYYITVYDTDFKLLWRKSIDFDNVNPNSLIDNMGITNNGEVLITYHQFEKEVPKRVYYSDYSKIPEYTSYISRYSSGQSKLMKVRVDIKNFFIERSHISIENDGQVSLAGFYKAKPSGNLIGFFYGKIDLEAGRFNEPLIREFPADLLALIAEDGFGEEKGHKEEGIDRGFNIDYILNRDNGSIDLIAELWQVNNLGLKYRGSGIIYGNSSFSNNNSNFGNQRTGIPYRAGDILIINVSPSGKSVFTRIPKNQHFAYDIGMNYFPIIYNQHLLLFYNDQTSNITRDISKEPDFQGNFKKASFVQASIDANGNLKRKDLFTYKDETFVMMPSRARLLSGRQLFIPAEGASGLKAIKRFGIMSIK